jgi:formylglycine-generating enzyme required for sulfatase activity
MDKYEASVWRLPDPAGANKSLVKKIQQGKATQADLTGAGATQLGTSSDDYVPCNDDGQNCSGGSFFFVTNIYAVSLPGVHPSRFITWFQAQQACKNSRKRLPSNAEWQAAVAGTGDPEEDDGTTSCNILNTFTVPTTPTGSRSSCVSSDGAFDMVGNVDEWVADWVPSSTECAGWGGFSDDYMCLSGASETYPGPGALIRGGSYGSNTGAGPLSVYGSAEPSSEGIITGVGFRCAR